jgi:hypothetical protein
MTTPQFIAKHVREAHTGGRWACVNRRETLADVTLEEANAHHASFNTIATLIEQIPEAMLWEYLADEKYGVYYRILHGIVEHFHYHLGQIVIMKRLIRAEK